MTPYRRTSLVAGVFYLITFAAIPTLTLYSDVKADDYIIGSGSDISARWGGFLEVVVALACIGTAVTLFPVVRRQNEAMALGFVAARILEAAMIFAGVVSLLSLMSLRQAGATGAQAAPLVTVGDSLVAQYNFSFLLGQSLMPGVNALLLGTLLYQSGLVPRVIPLIGLVGAPIHLAAVVLTLFGVVDQISSLTMLAALPIAVWELCLGLYLVIKGFKPCALTRRRVVEVETSVAQPVG